MTKGRATDFEQRQEIVNYCLVHCSDYRATAELYGVSYAQVHNWVKKYKQAGVDGLEDYRGRGKPESQTTEIERRDRRIRELEAQLKQKEMENDLIKKFIELEKRWS